MHSKPYTIRIALVLVEIAHLTFGIDIQGILSETEPGCIAKVQTDTTVKWIYLKDDYQLLNGSV